MPDKPPWEYEGGPQPSPQEREGVEEILRRHGMDRHLPRHAPGEKSGAVFNRYAFDLAERESQAKRALARTLAEELLGTIAGDPLSIRRIAQHADKFREAHKLDPYSTRPVWLELERGGISREEIVALLNGERHLEKPPVEDPSPTFPNVDKWGNPKPTFANARVAIAALGITCRYDEFHDRLLVGGRVIEQWAGELADHVVVMLRKVILEAFKFDPGREQTRDAAVALCHEAAFDPVVEYLDALKWDGTPRLDNWIVEYLSAEDTALNRAIGRLMLLAAVRRARAPGCKFDQIIVLEGPEGRGKSSAIQLLAGKNNFSDQMILPLGEREQQEAIAGVWIYEIADLTGISKADVDRVKAFASRTEDRARPAYGRFRVSRPRRCIFIATTNSDTYLKSQTGNRRFWPVRVGRVDLAKLGADRDQLWAEAAVLEASGCSLVLPEEMWAQAEAEQQQRMDHDPWIDILGTVAGSKHHLEDGSYEERIAAAELLGVHLAIPRERQTDTQFKRLSACMRRLNWSRPELMRIGGSRARGYRRPVLEGTPPAPGRVTPTAQPASETSGAGGILAPGETSDDWAETLGPGR